MYFSHPRKHKVYQFYLEILEFRWPSGQIITWSLASTEAQPLQTPTINSHAFCGTDWFLCQSNNFPASVWKPYVQRNASLGTREWKKHLASLGFTGSSSWSRRHCGQEVQCKGVPQETENNSRLEAVGACSRRKQKSSQSPPFGWMTHSWLWHQCQGVWKGRGRKCGHCPGVGDTSVYIKSLIVCSLSRWFLPGVEVLQAIFKRATIFPVEEAKNTLW